MYLLVMFICALGAWFIGNVHERFGTVHGVEVAEQLTERMKLLQEAHIAREKKMFEEEDMRRRSRLYMQSKAIAEHGDADGRVALREERHETQWERHAEKSELAASDPFYK